MYFKRCVCYVLCVVIYADIDASVMCYVCVTHADIYTFILRNASVMCYVCVIHADIYTCTLIDV